jgi:hypothetical protein
VNLIETIEEFQPEIEMRVTNDFYEVFGLSPIKFKGGAKLQLFESPDDGSLTIFFIIQCYNSFESLTRHIGLNNVIIEREPEQYKYRFGISFDRNRLYSLRNQMRMEGVRTIFEFIISSVKHKMRVALKAEIDEALKANGRIDGSKPMPIKGEGERFGGRRIRVTAPDAKTSGAVEQNQAFPRLLET